MWRNRLGPHPGNTIYNNNTRKHRSLPMVNGNTEAPQVQNPRVGGLGLNRGRAFSTLTTRFVRVFLLATWFLKVLFIDILFLSQCGPVPPLDDLSMIMPETSTQQHTVRCIQTCPNQEDIHQIDLVGGSDPSHKYYIC